MSTISIRFEDEFLEDIETIMKENRYSTKAEFIREAIRDKIKKIEKEKSLERLEKAYGAGGNKIITEKEYRKARKEAAEEISKRFD